MKFLIAIVLAYSAGGFPTSVLLSKMFFKKDVRDFGSMNPGAMNVWRVFGLRMALVVLAVDFFKGYFAAAFIPSLIGLTESAQIALILGMFAVFGHIWSPFTKFTGGKGIGAAFGVATALYPMAALVSFGLWLIVGFFSNTASIASLVGVTIFPVLMFWLYSISNVEIAIGIGLIVLMFYTHRANIQRLRDGQELKIGENR